MGMTVSDRPFPIILRAGGVPDTNRSQLRLVAIAFQDDTITMGSQLAVLDFPKAEVHASLSSWRPAINDPIHRWIPPVLDLDPVRASPGAIERSGCFDTMPSRFMSQAARNRSGPISPRSNGATKLPSGRRASTAQSWS